MRFDGTNAPTMKVSLAQAGNATSDLTSALTWTDFTATDVQSISITRGIATEFDSPQSGKCVIVVDNYSTNYDPANTGGTFGANLELGKPMQVAGVFGATTYPRFRGYIDDISPDVGFQPTTTITLVDGLDQLARANIPPLRVYDYFGQLVDNPAYDGDTTGTRIGRILDLAGRPATMRALDTGYSLCQKTIFGDFALNLIAQVVATELGFFFQDATGTLQFKDRYAVLNDTQSTTSQATISDVGTDVDMLSMARQRSFDQVYNDATILRNASPVPPGVPNLRLFPQGPLRFTNANEWAETPLGQNVQDATSIGKFGVRSYPNAPGQLLRDDTYSYAMAQWLVSRYKTPTNIISQVSVDAAQNGTSLWSTLLALDLLERIRVKRTYGRPTGFATDVQLLILGIQEDISPDAWTFTFNTVDPARLTQSNFVLDTSVLGTNAVGF